jgi:phenylalanine-4-hydroxylase
MLAGKERASAWSAYLRLCWTTEGEAESRPGPQQRPGTRALSGVLWGTNSTPGERRRDPSDHRDTNEVELDMDCEAVPAHLRKYVVAQDYDAYSARDQAVWRFVVTETHARHLRTAHAAYAHGFAAAGISVDRIPNIVHMSEQLSRVGFQAVCVDGFIPPRAFQAFQARGVLPIAADMRSVAQLAYTPAPDIIHEAAGHAPFLAHPDYAHYLRRIGQAGEHAFETAHDRAVYRAIYLLSELKQQSDTTAEQVSRAELTLAALYSAEHEVSEATLLSRLYWWTVEYGLVGTPLDYRLYGAGLLSSIGEGHFCHAPEVEKRALTADCTELDYDITRAQPHLFVARDFAHLHDVLSSVERQLSYARGGHEALKRAQESEEIATLRLGTGFSLVGKVDSFDDACVMLRADAAVVDERGDTPRISRVDGPYCLPLGQLDDGTPLDRLTVAALRARQGVAGLCLRTRQGVTVHGRLGPIVATDERVYSVLLHDCTIVRGAALCVPRVASYELVFARAVETATPLVPDGYYPATEASPQLVPRPREHTPTERALDELHQRASAALHGRLGGGAAATLEQMHHQLVRAFPEEWLLRFNLLEALIRLGERGGALAARLEAELEELELRFSQREPIATGLRSLRALG